MKSADPGGTADFRFYYTVPNYLAPGTYREYFRPIMDGVTRLVDPNFDLSWDITVLTPKMAIMSNQWMGQNANPTLHVGQSYQF